MRRIPIVPTLIVALAIAAMITLGFWQLERLKEKEAALAQYGANLHRPLTAYPANPTDESYLFRTVSAHCLHVTGWQAKGGHLPDGNPGWRHIATCATGAEGPGLIVDIGMTATPDALPQWDGGQVRGTAIWEPDARSALMRWISKGPPLRLMIVSETPAPGLQPSPRPDPSSVPNNHLSYAVQWFLFAAVAAIIYGVAVWQRMQKGK
jgi:cytochrome oxidase assembly protein ShyY1